MQARSNCAFAASASVLCDVVAAKALEVPPRFADQVWRDKRHHLKGPASRILGVAAGRVVSNRPEVEPVRRDHKHVFRERPDLRRARLHEPPGHETPAKGLRCRELRIDDLVEVRAQAAIASDDVVEIAIGNR